MKKVLLICTGNTCRSPMAEGLFKQMLRDKDIKDVEVSSAGIAAYEGDPVSEYAVAVLTELGIDISAHRAKQLTPFMLEEADLILVMTPSHAKAILTQGETIHNKTKILKAGIPDPYGGNIEEYRTCRDALSQALQEVLENEEWE